MSLNSAAIALRSGSSNMAIPANIIDAINSLINQINASAGTSFLLYYNPGGTGNGADTTEDTLATYPLPGGTLAAVGQGLRITAYFALAANGDNKTMKLYFGSEVIATPTAATNNKNAMLQLQVLKTAANVQIVNGNGIVDTTAVTPYSAAGAETDTSAITIKATGQAGTGNANDIVLKQMTVEFLG